MNLDALYGSIIFFVIALIAHGVGAAWLSVALGLLAIISGLAWIASTLP